MSDRSDKRSVRINLTPRWLREQTLSGTPIEISSNGTTSVSSGSLSQIASRRFKEMSIVPDAPKKNSL